MRKRIAKIQKDPQLNVKATKARVEMELYRYQEYLNKLPENLMPKLTPGYSLIPPTFTNEFRSTTEEAAVARAEYEKERTEFMNMIHEEVGRLKEDERRIIVNYYLLPPEQQMDNMTLWLDMGLGKTKYHEIKTEALLRLAFFLKVEVYRSREVRSA